MKNKPHKGLLKRIRISKTGKVQHRTTGHKHLRSGKGGKRLRQMRKHPYMSNPDAKKLEKLLFRRLRGRNQPRAALKRSPSPAESKAIKEAKRVEAAAITAGTATAPSLTTKTGRRRAGAATAPAARRKAPKAAAKS